MERTLRDLRRPERSPLGVLSRELRMSHKHLIACFREQVGTTPRTLLQIQRFQSVLRRVRGRDAGAVDWANVAQASGYFDQPHLIRAFHRFAGATPSEYLSRRDDDENHIVINAR